MNEAATLSAYQGEPGGSAWPVGGSELGRLIRSFDWSKTSLGPIETWPQSLKTATDLLLQSPVPMVMLWGEDGVMIYNDAYSVFAGGRHPQLLGSKVREGWPEVAEFNDNVMRVGLSGGTLAYKDQELTLYRSGKPEQVWMNLDYSPVLDESGRPAGVLAIVIETTERVRAEAALRESEARASGVLEGMAEGFVLLDRDFRVLAINAEGLRVDGRQREAILGKTHWEAWPGSEKSELGQLYKRAMADRVPVSLEHRYVWPDGRDAWIEMRAYPSGDGLALFYRDVTERKRAEARLQASEEFGRRVLASSGDCIKVLDQNGRMESMSEGGQRALAITDLDPFVGTYWAESFEPEGRPEARRAVAAARAGQTYRFEAGLRTQTGELRWWDSVLTPIMNADGQPEKILALSRDITDRKIVEDRQKFLLELGDRVRDLPEPTAVTMTAAELLGRHLGAARAGYGEIDDAQEVVAVARDWTNGIVPSIAGEARLLDGFGPKIIAELKAGRTLVVDDFHSDPRAGAGYAAAWDSIATRALIVVPLVKGGRLRAILYVHEPEPRSWTEAEIALAENTAERTWDAVERADAEARLRASEAKFEAIANSIDQMIWSTTPDGYHDYYNQRWYDYTGVAEGSTDGEAWNGMFHPDDQERAWARWRDSLATGEPYEIEYRLRHASGEYRWVLGRAQCVRDEAGRITRWYGTCTDIHDQKLAEDALRESRDRLAEESHALEVLNRTGAQVAAELGLETLVQRVVDAGVELTGAQFGAFFYNVLDERGESYMLYALSGADRGAFEGFGMPRATHVFAPTFRGHGVIRSGDILQDPRYGKNAPHFGLPKGHLPVRSYLAVPVTSRSGEVIGGLFFGHEEPDIFTERAERVMTGLAAQAAIGIDNARLFEAVQKANAELEDRVRARTAELEQAHEALRQSQKMEAVGQLTGGIAHDFNNMLAVVIGSLELLGRRIGSSDARARRYVDAASEGARRAALLTQRLLAFSRQQPLQPEPIDANKLVAGMSDLLRHSLGSDIRLEVVLARDLWRTHADPNQLENVILNLAVNARDAMPEGGWLRIQTQNAQLDPTYVAHHPGASAGEYVLLAVTDTGVGMPAEVVAKAFDPFFTTKEVGKGTGLGLSQVYGFVKQSGGYVEISSEPGRGTTVNVYLPRFTGSEIDDPHGEASTELLIAEQQEVVLVVEDEAVVRQFSVDALAELGYRVLEADGAAAALRQLEAHPEIALLFTDVVMPEVNGAKLAEEARRRRPDLKILFTTGYSRDAVVRNGVIDPGIELIGKPFTIEQLAAKVREVLDATASLRGA